MRASHPSLAVLALLVAAAGFAGPASAQQPVTLEFELAVDATRANGRIEFDGTLRNVHGLPQQQTWDPGMGRRFTFVVQESALPTGAIAQGLASLPKGFIIEIDGACRQLLQGRFRGLTPAGRPRLTFQAADTRIAPARPPAPDPYRC